MALFRRDCVNLLATRIAHSEMAKIYEHVAVSQAAEKVLAEIIETPEDLT